MKNSDVIAEWALIVIVLIIISMAAGCGATVAYETKYLRVWCELESRCPSIEEVEAVEGLMLAGVEDQINGKIDVRQFAADFLTADYGCPLDNGCSGLYWGGRSRQGSISGVIDLAWMDCVAFGALSHELGHVRAIAELGNANSAHDEKWLWGGPGGEPIGMINEVNTDVIRAGFCL